MELKVGSIEKISENANKIMSKKLIKLLNSKKPDIVISTHPFSSQMCAYLKKKEKVNFKLATILTDYAIHSQWLVYPDYVDYFFVAHSEMKSKMEELGIPSFKIFVTGIPVSIGFSKTYDKEKTCKMFNLSPNKMTVLFCAGGEFGLGQAKIGNIFETFIKDFPEVQIAAVAGKNNKVKDHFIKIVKENNASENVKVFAYTKKMPELMSISDFIISKPGGLTTTESLISGLPIIIINPIPGQEEENAEFLQRRNVGLWLNKDSNIKKVLTPIINSNKLLNAMKTNALNLAKKNSTENICKILLDL